MLAALTVPMGPPLPVPEMVTVWGELPAESVNVSVPEYAVLSAGANVSVTVQLAPAPSVLPHVVAKVKTLLPDSEMPAMLSAPVPPFCSVKVWLCVFAVDTVPKLMLLALKMTLGVFPPTPVPLRLTVRVAVAFSELLVNVRLPEIAPLATGTNSTATPQLPPAARASPALQAAELVVCWKGLLMVKPESVSVWLPILTGVTVCARLARPAVTLEKLSAAAVSATSRITLFA